jgi:hypothetical protein
MPVAERLAEAEQYVRSADALTRLGDHDNVTSRAYYAVFHCCVALLQTLPGPLQGSSDGDARGWHHRQALALAGRLQAARLARLSLRKGMTGKVSLVVLQIDRGDTDCGIGDVSAPIAPSYWPRLPLTSDRVRRAC